MQKIILFAACLLILSTVYGQNKSLTLSGKITDAQTGEALAGANIQVADARIGATSDEHGQYVFKNIPAGHHIMEVSFSGFNTTVLHIDVNENTTKDFALMPAVREQQGITITGVAQATNIRNSPVPAVLHT